MRPPLVPVHPRSLAPPEGPASAVIVPVVVTRSLILQSTPHLPLAPASSSTPIPPSTPSPSSLLLLHSRPPSPHPLYLYLFFLLLLHSHPTIHAPFYRCLLHPPRGTSYCRSVYWSMIRRKWGRAYCKINYRQRRPRSLPRTISSTMRPAGHRLCRRRRQLSHRPCVPTFPPRPSTQPTHHPRYFHLQRTEHQAAR